MKQVTGRIFISLNCERIRSKAGASLEIGGTKSTPIYSDQGVHFGEEFVAPTVECKINDTAGVSVDDFRNFKGSLAFETDTGKAYTLHDARIVDPPKMANGEWALKFMAAECVEN